MIYTMSSQQDQSEFDQCLPLNKTPTLKSSRNNAGCINYGVANHTHQQHLDVSDRLLSLPFMSQTNNFVPGFLSGLSHPHQLSMSHQSLQLSGGCIVSQAEAKTCEQVISELKKELHKCQVESEKERAIMGQKIEILEMQVKEREEREANIKRMHQTMMQALDCGQDEGGDSIFETRIRASSRSGSISEKDRLKTKLEEQRVEHELQLTELRSLLKTREQEVLLMEERCSKMIQEDYILEQQRHKESTSQMLKDFEDKTANLNYDHQVEFSNLEIKFFEELTQKNHIISKLKKKLEQQLDQFNDELKGKLKEQEQMHQNEIQQYQIRDLQLKAKQAEKYEELKAERDRNLLEANQLKEQIKSQQEMFKFNFMLQLEKGEQRLR